MEQWNNLTNELFNEIFKKSPVKRTKFSGLTWNIDFLRKNNFKKSNQIFFVLILSLLYLLLIKKRNHAQRFKKKRSFIISRKTKTR